MNNFEKTYLNSLNKSSINIDNNQKSKTEQINKSSRNADILNLPNDFKQSVNEFIQQIKDGYGYIDPDYAFDEFTIINPDYTSEIYNYEFIEKYIKNELLDAKIELRKNEDDE